MSEIKLKKPKSFEASKKRIDVSIEGSDYECANLLKSAIQVQSAVLLAYNSVWHEIDITKLTFKNPKFKLKNSDLTEFKKHIEAEDFTLERLKIVEEKNQTSDYSLKHDDFIELEKSFPKFPYFKISKLYKWELEASGRSGIYSIRQLLRILTDRNIDVDKWIDDSNTAKKNIINSNTSKMNPEDQKKEERIAQLNALGAKEKNGTFDAYGMVVTAETIEAMPDAGWDLMIQAIEGIRPQEEPVGGTAETPVDPIAAKKQRENDRMYELIDAGFVFEEKNGFWEKEGYSMVLNDRIGSITEEEWAKYLYPESLNAVPMNEAAAADENANTDAPAATNVPATAEKKPISLETVGKLTPDRFKELKDLESETKALLLAHPIPVITDKKSRDEAKKSVGILLKASTAIDSPTTGIIANKNKFLKMVSSTLDVFLDKEAKARRARHQEIKDVLEKWDNAEDLRLQAEQKAKLEKIKTRTGLLFSAGMVLKESTYEIGTLYVMPSQIESATDEEFTELVKKAEEQKKLLDAEKEAAAKKDEVIINMAKQLSKVNGKPVEQIIAEMSGKVWVPPTELGDAGPEKETAAPQTAQTSPTMPAAPLESAPAATNMPAASTAAATEEAPGKSTHIPRFVPSKEYTEAEPGDATLLKFDLEHLDVLQDEKTKASVIKCREYLKYGRRLLAIDIRRILASDSKTKSAEISALLDIIEK